MLFIWLLQIYFSCNIIDLYDGSPVKPVHVRSRRSPVFEDSLGWLKWPWKRHKPQASSTSTEDLKTGPQFGIVLKMCPPELDQSQALNFTNIKNISQLKGSKKDQKGSGKCSDKCNQSKSKQKKSKFSGEHIGNKREISFSLDLIPKTPNPQNKIANKMTNKIGNKRKFKNAKRFHDSPTPKNLENVNDQRSVKKYPEQVTKQINIKQIQQNDASDTSSGRSLKASILGTILRKLLPDIEQENVSLSNIKEFENITIKNNTKVEYMQDFFRGDYGNIPKSNVTVTTYDIVTKKIVIRGDDDKPCVPREQKPIGIQSEQKSGGAQTQQKPTVSVSETKPTSVLSQEKPSSTVSVKKPSSTVSVKKPSSTVSGKKPSSALTQRKTSGALGGKKPSSSIGQKKTSASQPKKRYSGLINLRKNIGALGERKQSAIVSEKNASSAVSEKEPVSIPSANISSGTVDENVKPVSSSEQEKPNITQGQIKPSSIQPNATLEEKQPSATSQPQTKTEVVNCRFSKKNRSSTHNLPLRIAKKYRKTFVKKKFFPSAKDRERLRRLRLKRKYLTRKLRQRKKLNAYLNAAMLRKNAKAKGFARGHSKKLGKGYKTYKNNKWFIRKRQKTLPMKKKKKKWKKKKQKHTVLKKQKHTIFHKQKEVKTTNKKLNK